MQFLVPSAVLAFATLTLVTGSPSGRDSLLQSRQGSDSIVSITNANSFCLIVPRNPHTNVGDSEYPGGEKTYCSSGGRTSSEQGLLPAQFWTQVEFKSGTGKNGKKYTQLTGCIQPSLLDRLNPGDSGGQYDSNGGVGGRGNPAGSKCLGHSSYVELLEPGGRRACVRCCDDPADCPVDKDTLGCQNVIPGNYFDCGH